MSLKAGLERSALRLEVAAVDGYDIIGDVHGCASALEALLCQLGYAQRQGCWRHPARKAIFVGDIIDRGPEIRRALAIVRAMVEEGEAFMTLGNHEYNAIVQAWITTTRPHPERFERLRQRLERHMRRTLIEFESVPAEWRDSIAWLRQQPLYLEADEFRVVHACWDAEKIAALQADYRQPPMLCEQFLQASTEPGAVPNRIVERLLKGLDLRLPPGTTVEGADGIRRDRFRTKFWDVAADTYGDVLFQPDKLPEALMQSPLTARQRDALVCYGAEQRPLFVGHYWCQGEPRLLRPNIACLDYSAVSNGVLAAYRFQLGEGLRDDQFVWVEA